MSRARVFVSSTCYDLRAIREYLKAAIDGLGHEALLSEYPSFPVSPDLSTVANCRKVVRESADVFILIIGGRRGALDPSSGRSVVNSEYREAKANGLDCYVFIENQIWSVLPQYKKTPHQDYSSLVDSTAVFTFIEEVIADSRWVFPFTRTEEIIAVLREQFSDRLRDLLLRSREGRIWIPHEYTKETAGVLQILADRSEYWEFTLTAALLRDRINNVGGKLSDIKRGFTFRRSKFLNASDSFQLVREAVKDIQEMIISSGKVLGEFNKAWGNPGTSGDPVAIIRTCDTLHVLLSNLPEWEMDLKFVVPHDRLKPIFESMRGWADEMLFQFLHIPSELDKLVNMAAKGTHHIELDIKGPSNIDHLCSLIDALSIDQQFLMDMYTER